MRTKEGKKFERNLKFYPASPKSPAHYKTEFTFNGKRVRHFAGYTREQARDYIARLRMKKLDGSIGEVLKPDQETKSKLFGDYARSILDSAEWKEKRSSARNEFSLAHLNRSFRSVALKEISPAKVRDYITGRRKEASPATVNRELSFLKSVLYCAEADGIIESNPIRGRRIKKLKENNHREEVIVRLDLKDEDFERLIDCADDPLRAILNVALFTGMRLGEILKLRQKDVNLKLGTILVREENSKSKKARIIPFGARLYPIFAELGAKREFVFLNPRTQKPFKSNRPIEFAFIRACERADIAYGRKEGGLTFHDLRHFFAYKIVRVTDIKTASKILGHSDVKMTMRYLHSTELDQREAISKLEETFLVSSEGRQKSVTPVSEKTGKELENLTQVH